MDKEAIAALKIVLLYGSEVIFSEGMQSQKLYIQHGDVSIFDHSLRVACLSIRIARRLGLKVDHQAIVRGALLHDYFLYDWHIPDSSRGLHGFSHARCALNNAMRDFSLREIEKDIIVKHMFPLNITPPKYKESFIVCFADKVCAAGETFSIKKTG